MKFLIYQILFKKKVIQVCLVKTDQNEHSLCSKWVGRGDDLGQVRIRRCSILATRGARPFRYRWQVQPATQSDHITVICDVKLSVYIYIQFFYTYFLGLFWRIQRICPNHRWLHRNLWLRHYPSTLTHSKCPKTVTSMKTSSVPAVNEQ
jgi:hypothetical protein